MSLAHERHVMTEVLADRTAVVTGGASGIGRAIALECAEAGADVVVADLAADPRGGGTPTREAIDVETTRDAAYVECDVTEAADLQAAVAAADEFGGVDVMVNNAGIVCLESFLEVSEGDYDAVMDSTPRGCSSARRRPPGRWSRPNAKAPSSTCPASPAWRAPATT
jgi:NAD(P)-dependent dehydrogenase (short-subunit alcohol dehydrogenase family)